jgi:TonB family protein
MRGLLLAIAGLAMVALLLDSQITVAQLPQSFPCDPDLPQLKTLEVLDYLSEVDLRPYLSALKESVKENWYSIMPNEARPPVRKKGCVTMTFSVSQEGKLANMKIADSYGDQQLDEAARQAIFLSSPFPSLPSGAPSWVRFRFRFYYNPDFGPSPSRIESVNALLEQSAFIAANLPPLRSENPPPVRIDLIPMGGQTPRGLSMPTPPYALPVGSAPVRGIVLLSLVVTKKGEPHHVKVLKGLNPVVDEAARKTIETWKFEPAMRYGRPIEMPLNIQITFNLK